MVHMCVMVESVSFAYLGSLSLKMATGALSEFNLTLINWGEKIQNKPLIRAFSGSQKWNVEIELELE